MPSIKLKKPKESLGSIMNDEINPAKPFDWFLNDFYLKSKFSKRL